VADSDRLSRAIREVATGGSMLDPEIVQALVSPAREEGALSDEQENSATQRCRRSAGEGDRSHAGRGQLNVHRKQMNAAILTEGGTVMQYVGDAVMAVLGAPDPRPGHASSAVRAAVAMHGLQRDLYHAWAAQGLAAFGLGIGLSTGDVAAAHLGSAERLEYTLVGDTVNLAQRLQDLARPAGTTVASEATVLLADGDWDWDSLGEREVKGRETPVAAYRQMQDRLGAIGGVLNIEPAVGAGTTVCASVPAQPVAQGEHSPEPRASARLRA
jgi:class 3 adenylate cyclase